MATPAPNLLVTYRCNCGREYDRFQYEAYEAHTRTCTIERDRRMLEMLAALVARCRRVWPWPSDDNGDVVGGSWNTGGHAGPYCRWPYHARCIHCHKYLCVWTPNVCSECQREQVPSIDPRDIDALRYEEANRSEWWQQRERNQMAERLGYEYL